MKKFISFLLILFVLIFVGCSQKTDYNKTSLSGKYYLTKRNGVNVEDNTYIDFIDNYNCIMFTYLDTDSYIDKGTYSFLKYKDGYNSKSIDLIIIINGIIYDYSEEGIYAKEKLVREIYKCSYYYDTDIIFIHRIKYGHLDETSLSDVYEKEQEN